MTAIYLTGTTIVFFNIAGIIFALFMLAKRSEISPLKRTAPSGNGFGTGIETNESRSTGIIAGAAAASAGTALENDLDDDDEFDDIDDILDKLDLNDFDSDLDFNDFD